MTAIVSALLLVGSGALLAWSYLAYPFVIRRLAERASAPSAASVGGAALPTVEVVISAADEESVIAHRVENLLAQETPPRVSIGCDGCADATAARARAAGGDRVTVVEFPERRGKAAVLNDLVRSSRADVLVFTDANTRFEREAVRQLLLRFENSSVGAVCGRLLLDRGSSVGSAEAAFWDRETLLKEAEGRLGLCLGANGAIYAARRELVQPLSPDTTSMDDFLIPARIAKEGRAVVFAADAIAREAAGRDVPTEMARRLRIGIGAGQVLRRERWLFDFRRHGRLSLVFFSRKAARWLAPVLAIAGLLVGLGDSRLAGPAGAALALVLVAVALARTRPRLSGGAGTLYYFLVINVALAAGVVAGLVGYRRPAWRRRAR